MSNMSKITQREVLMHRVELTARDRLGRHIMVRTVLCCGLDLLSFYFSYTALVLSIFDMNDLISPTVESYVCGNISKN